MINALLLDDKDNVVTCIADVAAGEAVTYRRGKEICTIIAREAIPYCHKVALYDLEQNADVIKYGETLGRTTQAIPAGGWVSHLNVVSIPRDYESELIDLSKEDRQ